MQFFVTGRAGGSSQKLPPIVGENCCLSSLGTMIFAARKLETRKMKLQNFWNAREEPASAATSPSQVSTTVSCLVWEGLGCFKHCHEAMSLKRLIG